jgi:ABC-type glycerol-3-phosphate transport system substrate-binding protein
MYRIIDWIMLNRRLSLLIGGFVGFIVFLLLAVLILGSNKQKADLLAVPLQGSTKKVNAFWWTTGIDSKTSGALSKLVTSFKNTYAYPNFNTSIEIKANSKEFFKDFVSKPLNRPTMMFIEDKYAPYYQKNATPNAYLKARLLADYADNSVIMVKDNTVASETVYGVPLYTDNLQMYVNQNLLTNVGGTIATDWQTVLRQSETYASTSGNTKNIKLINLGGDSNSIPQVNDIISAMLLQKGTDINRGVITGLNEAGPEVLEYYSQYKQKWDNSEKAFDLFTQGRLIYYIDYYSAYDKLIQSQPNLNNKIDIVKLPTFGKVTPSQTHAKFFTNLINAEADSDPETKKILDDFNYFLTTEPARKIFADATKYPSVSKNIVEVQKNSKFAETENRLRRFYDQANVSKALIPYCSPTYYRGWDTMITKMSQVSGSALSNDKAKEIWSQSSNDIETSLQTQNVCFPFKLEEY